jgi:class 3 adenylate cyclase
MQRSEDYGSKFETVPSYGRRIIGAVIRSLPEGTITFLFTDIEGSTRLLQRLGGGYGELLGTHARLLRAAAARHAPSLH